MKLYTAVFISVFRQFVLFLNSFIWPLLAELDKILKSLFAAECSEMFPFLLFQSFSNKKCVNQPLWAVHFVSLHFIILLWKCCTSAAQLEWRRSHLYSCHQLVVNHSRTLQIRSAREPPFMKISLLLIMALCRLMILLLRGAAVETTVSL